MDEERKESDDGKLSLSSFPNVSDFDQCSVSSLTTAPSHQCVALPMRSSKMPGVTSASASNVGSVQNETEQSFGCFEESSGQRVFPLVASLPPVMGDDKNEASEKNGDGNERNERNTRNNTRNERLLARAQRKKPKKSKPERPPVDKTLAQSYKRSLVNFWKGEFDFEATLSCLTDSDAPEKRGLACRKHVRTLCDLGKEHLFPEEFAKHEGVLFRWEFNCKMPESNCSGMKGLVSDLSNISDETNDWLLPEGVSATLCLMDDPEHNKKKTWNPWVCIKKSSVAEAGNGLFAAREFQKGETIGF
jgi:hypothetical protein